MGDEKPKKNYYRIANENRKFIQYLKNLDCEEIHDVTKKGVCNANRNECNVSDATKTGTESEHVSDSSDMEENILNTVSDCDNVAENVNDAEVNKIAECLDNSSTSSHSSIVQLDSVSLTDQLKGWYNEYNVSLEAFRGILKIFHPFHL